MRIKIFLLSLILSSAFAKAQKIIAYQGKISFDSLKILNAAFDIKYHNDTSKEIQFYINKNAVINSLKIDNKNILYETEFLKNFMPDLKKITIHTLFPQTFNLEISYSYNLTKIENPTFIYNPHWIELSFYTGWFPVNLNDRNYSYTLDFEVPENYKIISPGKIDKHKNHVTITNENNATDIPVVLSDEFQIFHTENNKVQFYGINLQPKTIEDAKNTSENIFTLYEKRFGVCNSGNLIVAINSLNHIMSYSRKGFISLSFKDEFADKAKRTLAHEIGHLWWENAPFGTWQDWLNESFAEYSSLIWAEKNMAEKDFDLLLKKYENNYEKQPLKISQVKNQEDPNWFSVIYVKGAYMLYKLNKDIGDEKMDIFLRKTNQMKTSNTKDLLELLKTETDEKTVESFAKDIE
jgi:hypothetical protein